MGLEILLRVVLVVLPQPHCVVLGAKKLYFNVNFNSETFQVYDKSVDCAKVDDNPLFLHESKKWPLIASLLGNDYVKRIPNVGHATIFKKILPKLLVWDDQDAMNTYNENLRYKISQQHVIELNKSINLLRHAPILCEENV